MAKIQVLIVDDSAVVRQVLSEELGAQSDIEVLATAPDPLFALEKMKVHWPDVIVLDVEMPRMDGVTFLQQVMATRPTPVIICSSLVGTGEDVTLRALSAGAFAIVEKPKIGVRDFLKDSSESLVSVVKEAGDLLHEMVPSIRRTADLVQEITAASLEQSGSIQSINDSVLQLTSATQSNASATEELSATAAEMSSEAVRLQSLLAWFHIE